MDRKKELTQIVCKEGSENETILLPLVEKVIFLENELDKLQQFPFYKVNPENPTQQKVLPVFKVYKETLQQYTNCIKVLSRAIGVDDNEGESPLRKWVNERNSVSDAD